MRLEYVDLYEYFGVAAPEGGKGKLTAYIQDTPEQLRPRLRPAVLILPGGGYHHVSQREAEPVALRFLARGYQVFCLEYSVAPVVFPAQLREAAMAMAYIRKHAAVLDVNPGQVAAVGFSAGGHLCGMLGMLFDSEEVAAFGQPALLRPDALGLCYPVAVSWGKTNEGTFENLCGGDAALRQRLSLERLVRSDMPPVFLWHTRDDDCVPCRNSLILADALEQAGVDLALHLYRRGPHGLSTADYQVYLAEHVPETSRSVPGWLDMMVEFLAEFGFVPHDGE